jgi:hypothetical protein
LTYRTSDRRVGLPQVFATTEFARWVTDEVHRDLGKVTMANGMLGDMPWGADLFGFMGRETDWLRTGELVPDSDARLSYQRTLAYQRPYGLLMNTDFDHLTHERVERYFQVALFYGIYPSMFSHNAAEDRYWDDPTLYERDRPLFRRYVPLIRDLNRGGWQPVTHATTSKDSVYVERFGAWPDLRFTLRNMDEDRAAAVVVTLRADALALPPLPLGAHALLAGSRHPLSAPAGRRTVSLTLDPGASEILHFKGSPVYLPLACTLCP